MKREMKPLDKGSLHQLGKQWKNRRPTTTIWYAFKEGVQRSKVERISLSDYLKIYARKKIIFINAIDHTSRHPRRKTENKLGQLTLIFL